MNMEESVQQQEDYKDKRLANLAPYMFKKGQSGNPMGRPQGSSLKERAKKYLAGLTDEEAVEFFEGMNKKDVWEMAEGKARQDTELGGQLKIINVTVPGPVAQAFNINATDTEAIGGDTQ